MQAKSLPIVPSIKLKIYLCRYSLGTNYFYYEFQKRGKMERYLFQSYPAQICRCKIERHNNS